MREIFRMERIGGGGKLKYASLNIMNNEIVGLLGLNNAGKTDLLKIISGFSSCKDGFIYVDERRVKLTSPLDAMSHGIHYIHDDNALINGFTVAENIFVMKPLRKGSLVNHKKLVIECERLLERLCIESIGVSIMPNDKAGTLPPLHRLVVLIARAVSSNARIIIIDHLLYEFPPHWIEIMHKLIGILTSKLGVSLLLTDCRPDSLLTLCDRIFVLREGKTAGVINPGDCDEKTLASMMTGYLIEDELRNVVCVPPGKEVLSFQNLKLPNVQNELSFQLLENETVGLCCMSSSFTEQLMDVLLSRDHARGGKIMFEGKNLNLRRMYDLHHLGIGVVSDQNAIFTNMGMQENISVMAWKRFSSKLGTINKSATSFAVSEVLSSYDSSYKRVASDVALSKLAERQIVILRNMATIPKVMIYINLDRDLDPISYSRLLRQISKTPNKPNSSVFVSPNIHSLLSVCTKIYFIHNGKIVQVVYPASSHYKDILTYYKRFCMA